MWTRGGGAILDRVLPLMLIALSIQRLVLYLLVQLTDPLAQHLDLAA